MFSRQSLYAQRPRTPRLQQPSQRSNPSLPPSLPPAIPIISPPPPPPRRRSITAAAAGATTVSHPRNRPSFPPPLFQSFSSFSLPRPRVPHWGFDKCLGFNDQVKWCHGRHDDDATHTQLLIQKIRAAADPCVEEEEGDCSHGGGGGGGGVGPIARRGRGRKGEGE